MKGLDRNLKYWLMYLAKTTGLTTLLILGITALTSLMDGADFVETFMNMVPTYLLMMVCIITVVYAFVNISVTFPMTVAFGSTRRSSLAGMVISNHVIGAVLFALAIASVCLSNASRATFILAYWGDVVGAFFIMMGVGNFVSFFTGKTGRIVGILLYILTVIVCCIGGVYVAMLGMDMILAGIEVLTIGNGILMLLIGLVFDILGFITLYLGMRKQELKFC